jgi:hypothetical protein
MKKSVSMFFLLACSLFLAGLIGCSDDESSTNSNLVTGNVDDPEFVAFLDAVGGTDEFNGIMFDELLGFLDSVQAMPPLATPNQRQPGGAMSTLGTDSVFITYHESSQYWYRYISSSDTIYNPGAPNEITNASLEDSIQFLHADGPVQWPDSALLVGLNTGAALSVEVFTPAPAKLNTTGSAVASQRLSFEGDIIEKGNVTIAGVRAFAMDFSGDFEICSFGVDLAETLANIQMNISHVDSGGCPSSGLLTQIGTVSATCTGENPFTFSDTWTIVQTFLGNDMHRVVAENSTTRWEYTGSCRDDVQQSASLAARVARVMNSGR